MHQAPTFRSPHALNLYQRIADRTATTCVIGLGYAGLPLAIELGRTGFRVVGVDTDAGKRAVINGGYSDVPDVPDSAVSDLVAVGRLTALPAPAAADRLDAIIICVPTPLRKTRDPDLSYVVSACHAVEEQLRPGMLVILESTTYPGTTDDLVRAILEESGLTAGEDFFLAFSPERIDPGNQTWTIKNVPKVVGGLSPDCSVLAGALYRTFVGEVVQVRSPRTAEMVKLLENTFRAVNIGLVNEMALMCDRLGVDVWEVIDAAASKPFGFMRFYPGPGLGGHCIPVDPFYLSWKAREAGFEARFIDLAGQVNAAMPGHVVEVVADALGRRGIALTGAKVNLLGIAYKAGVGDVRESPALDVLALLARRGAVVSYHDPFVPSIDPNLLPAGLALESTPLTQEWLGQADCVVVLTDHAVFDYDAVVSACPLVVDTRNAVKVAAPNVVRLGAPVVADGGPPESPRLD